MTYLKPTLNVIGSAFAVVLGTAMEIDSDNAVDGSLYRPADIVAGMDD